MKPISDQTKYRIKIDLISTLITLIIGAIILMSIEANIKDSPISETTTQTITE